MQGHYCMHGHVSSPGRSDTLPHLILRPTQWWAHTWTYVYFSLKQYENDDCVSSMLASISTFCTGWKIGPFHFKNSAILCSAVTLLTLHYSSGMHGNGDGKCVTPNQAQQADRTPWTVEKLLCGTSPMRRARGQGPFFSLLSPAILWQLGP